MIVVDERPQQRPEEQAQRPGRTVWVAVGLFVLLVVVFWFAWPLGVVLGLAAGVVVTIRFGVHQQRIADATATTGALDEEDDEELRQEVRRLRVRIGDDWPAFTRAVGLVARAQTASAALLQRDLGLPTGQAQHVLRLLEREGFVGGPRGTRPREVRVDRESAARLEALLHA